MNSLDFDYAAMTSGAVLARVSDVVASLYRSTDQEGEPFGLNLPLFYLDPLAFNDHLEQTPPALWPREFRRSAAIIRETGEKYADWNHGDETVKDVLAACLVCLHSMAQEYAPEVAAEILPTACKARPEEMPDKLAIVFAALRAEKCLNAANKPTTETQADIVYLAKEVAALVGVRTWAKTFARPWGVKNPRQTGNQLTALSDFRRRVKQALTTAVRDNVVLQETTSGKDLLKLSSMSTK